MGSYFIWNSIGIYPSTGSDIYLISSPTFKYIQLALPDGKHLTVTAHNLSRENVYIVEATLNGLELHRAWFRHGEIKYGANFVFLMGSEPGTWGTTELPPSDTLSCNDHL